MAVHAIDAQTLRFLELHETRVHALPGRRVRDLGDAVLLHDPLDREPFWNRLAAVTFPADPRAFERRLDEVITLFATLDRLPHVWPRPLFNEPVDLVDRLLGAGFVDIGGGLVMLLDDPAPSAELTRRPRPDLEIERLHLVDPARRRAVAPEIALVLAESFDVEPSRRDPIADETAAMFDRPEQHAYLVRVGGEPAAVAKRATFDGATYLSSIGTRPRFRGRGLGALATALAVEDGLAAGSRWTYLGVFTENHAARRVYERLGFVAIGGPVPDLLLR